MTVYVKRSRFVLSLFLLVQSSIGIHSLVLKAEQSSDGKVSVVTTSETVDHKHKPAESDYAIQPLDECHTNCQASGDEGRGACKNGCHWAHSTLEHSLPKIKHDCRGNLAKHLLVALQSCILKCRQSSVDATVIDHCTFACLNSYNNLSALHSFNRPDTGKMSAECNETAIDNQQTSDASLSQEKCASPLLVWRFNFNTTKCEPFYEETCPAGRTVFRSLTSCLEHCKWFHDLDIMCLTKRAQSHGCFAAS